MGKLVARKYPTNLFLRLADHTYVECGSGARGWKCWGGKTGGQAFKSGTGSTHRANEIAYPDERAGIKRYLIDGVCHQAANRILRPARLTVSGARGYDLSMRIFHLYGRCMFNTFPNESGDLSECMAGAGATEDMPKLSAEEEIERGRLTQNEADHLRFWSSSPSAPEIIDFNIRRFLLDVEFLFKGELSARKFDQLNTIKSGQERHLHALGEAHERAELDPVEFVIEFNKMTERFQMDVAEVLDAGEYRRLLGEERGEVLILADPVGIDAAYGEGTAARVYGR